MKQERTYTVGTRFEAVEQKDAEGRMLKGHPQFGRPFEVTDAYRDGTVFFKYINPKGAAEPYERVHNRTTLQEINAAVGAGLVHVEGESSSKSTKKARASEAPATPQVDGRSVREVTEQEAAAGRVAEASKRSTDPAPQTQVEADEARQATLDQTARARAGTADSMNDAFNRSLESNQADGGRVGDVGAENTEALGVDVANARLDHAKPKSSKDAHKGESHSKSKGGQ